MPIYTYECQKCGHKFDAFDKFTDPQERSCEAIVATDVEWHPEGGERCDGTARRVPSVAAFKFNCSMPTYQKPKT